MIFSPNVFFINPRTFCFFSFGNSLSSLSSAMQCLITHNKRMYPNNKILSFHHILVLLNQTKTHKLMFYLILRLKVLNR